MAQFKLYFVKHSAVGEYTLRVQAKMIKNKIQILWTLKMDVTTCKNKTEN